MLTCLQRELSWYKVNSMVIGRSLFSIDLLRNRRLSVTKSLQKSKSTGFTRNFARAFIHCAAFLLLFIIFSIQNVYAFAETRTQDVIKVTRQNIENRHNLEISAEDLKAQNIKNISSGKGTWVNLWNYPQDTQKFISRLKKFGIDTVYLQVNRSNTPVLKLQTEVDKILKDAHANNIKVIGWSYCYLKDITSDARKFVNVANYVSPDGESFDGMAADIEENTSLWAVRAYTKNIKRDLPKDYPLIAIVYSPQIKQDYPWEYVANNWDVLMPMTYWHGLKNRNHETVYNFVRDSITDLRRLSKKDNLNIHLITDGDRTNNDEVAASLKAAKDNGVNAGISIYPEHLASDEMLKKLGVY
jgi:hypothetical protein